MRGRDVFLSGLYFLRAAATFSHLSVLTLSVILILSRDDIHYILSIKKTGDTSYTCHLTV